ncbi:MAG TPA: MBL fold metallo-hydrolase [Clostridiaceae bacterium]|jgi:L-ascorbate metabolism protein UlaG (beta-lactamase superfamily)|nr:MBL fold metallo-hydrolase [Clostridiaceae bacterium]
MKIKWFGHACFLLTSKGGIRILTDPFDASVGYKVPEVEADIVTTSHDHYDHSYIRMAKGDFTHIRKPGDFNVHGISITGVSTYHDQDKGTQRGQNIVYKFTVDDVRVCHLGDLGHIPDLAQVERIGPVDVLLLPVGGTYTIDASDAVEVMKLLKPAVTIPMHYKTPPLKFRLDSVDNFLLLAGGGQRVRKQEVEISNDLRGIYVLDYE